MTFKEKIENFFRKDFLDWDDFVEKTEIKSINQFQQKTRQETVKNMAEPGESEQSDSFGSVVNRLYMIASLFCRLSAPKRSEKEVRILPKIGLTTPPKTLRLNQISVLLLFCRPSGCSEKEKKRCSV